jgi:hypothetical protein
MSRTEAVTAALLALGFQPAAAARDSRTRQILEQLYDQGASHEAGTD